MHLGNGNVNYKGTEVFFDQNDLIVSKTNLKGHITYANHTFLEIAGYEEAEVIGQPHNLIRHENMPRGVFELFWRQIANGQEIFAYVVNATKNGDHYWVVAHVTPSYADGRVNGYHSTRRVPDHAVIKSTIEPLYEELNAIEARSSDRKTGIQNSVAHLNGMLEEARKSYDEFVSSIMWGVAQ